MSIDPVCGMQVDEKNTENHTLHDGVKYYFCSEHCLTKFTKSPSKYLSDPKPAPSNQGKSKADSLYTCPMHPEIQEQKPGACPKCGMALEAMGVPVSSTKTEYTCPMHPEIVKDSPGACPKCGMALESRTVELEEDTSELDFMTLCFWVSTLLAIPIFLSAMTAEFWPNQMAEIIDPKTRQWLELLLSAPIVWWCGWVFYVRAVQSVIHRSLNMFTLIGLGVSVAWIYSLFGVVFPSVFPKAVFNDLGVVPVYFEAASVITALGDVKF